uniref:Uncharacterized protein n=1 Tax=Acrobeloides nanus TaxID=290746 RepID=A0A914EJ23_9BILA
MNKLYYLFLTIFAVVQVIKGTTEETTTIEVTTLNSPTTGKEDTRTTEGTAAKTGTAATEDTRTTEGTIAKTGTAATEDTIATAGTTTTQPITTKTTLSGVKTTPENVNKGAQLLFSCSANTCSFEFIVPELLLRHVNPDQLKQTIDLLSDQISSVKTELDLAKLNETTYSEAEIMKNILFPIVILGSFLGIIYSQNDATFSWDCTDISCDFTFTIPEALVKYVDPTELNNAITNITNQLTYIQNAISSVQATEITYTGEVNGLLGQVNGTYEALSSNITSGVGALLAGVENQTAQNYVTADQYLRRAYCFLNGEVSDVCANLP